MLRSLNPVTKGPAPVAMGRRRSSPDPRFGPRVELRGGHTPGQIDLTWIGKTLTSKRVATKDPPPALLQIQPARPFRNENMVDAWTIRQPGTCFQAAVATEIIRDDENVAGGIVGLDQFEQFDIIG